MEDYIEVNERINTFKRDYPNGIMNSEIVELDMKDGMVLFKVSVWKDRKSADGGFMPDAVGHAYELRNSTPINKTSYIENAETSAFGRALANLGLHVKRSVASKEEVERAREIQKLNNERAAEIAVLMEALRERGREREETLGFLRGNALDPKNSEHYPGIIEKLKGWIEEMDKEAESAKKNKTA